MLKTGAETAIRLQAAARIAASVFKAVETSGFCSLVLSGGNSPRELYRLLGRGIPLSAFREQGLSFPKNAITNWDNSPSVILPWESVMLFWGDERCVPSTHPDSNFMMAHESLLADSAIPKRNLFPMPHVIDHYDAAAQLYEKDLKRFFEKRKQAIRNSFPVFDVIILGMGSDGHTASLFPGDRAALGESARWVIAVHAPQGSPPGYRLSVTLPVINNANCVIFFVTGENKETMVRAITSGQRPDLPAGMVKPEHGELIWFYGT